MSDNLNCSRPGCTRGGLLKRGMCGACYATWRHRQIAYGRFESMDIDAAPARAHLQKFRERGLSWTAISKLTGISSSSLSDVGNGRSTKIRRTNAEKILATPVPPGPFDVLRENGYVPAIGATRRLQALMANGWGQKYLADRIGATPSKMSEMVHGHRKFVTASRYHAIREVFDELQLKQGPSSHARTVGVKHGWALPLEWDEELIDDPDAKPVMARRTKRDDVDGRKRSRIERVRELTAAGLTAEQIAARLGVSERQVQRDRSAAA